MNPVVMHIGLTKTGTSSLQAALSAHRDELAGIGFVYPLSGRTGKPRVAHHNLFYETGDGGRGNGDFDATDGGWAEVLRDIDAVPGRTGILSSEAFQYATPAQVERIGNILGDRPVTIVVYLRRHDRWLESAWNQRARFGRVTLRFVDFAEGEGRTLGDYAGVVMPWLQVFGDDHVDVRIYGAAVLERGIVGDFAAAHLGTAGERLPWRRTERSNDKAGIKHLLAVSTVADACRAELGDDFVLARRSAIRISSFFRGRPDRRDYTVMTFEQAIKIADDYEQSDERLAAASTSFRNAGPFADPEPGEFRDHVALELLGDDVFDDEERRFVARMAREIMKSATTPVEATR